ncbi:MAG: 6-phosphofructokinase [Myxococcales bacterium]|nr:6-phosphofructokinase [Myxococcales bacterium]
MARKKSSPQTATGKTVPPVMVDNDNLIHPDQAAMDSIHKILASARKYHGTKQKRVGMLFSGGPAPGGNAVISGAALSFLNDGWEVIGFYKGYEHLEQFNREKPRQFREGVHFKRLGYEDVTKIRQLGGIIIKTSRANPSKVANAEIRNPHDLIDPKRSVKLYNVLDALEFMGIQALISIGGDDTLKTAFYLHLLGLPVVHVPKTIDNDYYGIPWTFGYFTAIEHARQAIKVFNAEAQTTDSWWILELMGRKTGWYTLGAGIAGEAVRMIGPEEMGSKVDLNDLAKEIFELVMEREKYGKHYGVVLVSEGLVDRLPDDQRPHEVDEHGNTKFSEAFFGYRLSKAIGDLYKKTTGKKLHIKSETVGYTTRCAEPSAFDITLGSQLGMGAFRFIKEGLSGNMVSVGDNLEIKNVPFESLIDPVTFRTRLRFVPIQGDFFKLAKSLEFRRLQES